MSPSHRCSRFLPVVIAVLCGLGGNRPPDREAIDLLLDRVPPDASLVLEIRDLGDWLRALIDSPMGARLADSRVVRDWLDSEEGKSLRRARRDIETALGAPLLEIADGLAGEAVVLSLHLPDGAPPDDARGILQSAVTDRELLQAFIAAANGAERASGNLIRVDRREHGGVSYAVRVFQDGRPEEAYVLLDDGTFVWTNAERLLREVIDRASDPDLSAWGDRLARARIRSASPAGAIARLFIDPGLIGRMAATDPDAPALEDLPGPIAESIRAVEAIGLALEWRDGPILHVVEVLDPDLLPDPIRSWAARRGDPSALLGLIPGSALLAASGHVDCPALHDLIVASVPESGRPRLETINELARGLLLGLEPRSAILPAIGPGLVGWVDTPARELPLKAAPAVLVASIGDPAAAEAIDNALRTLLAFVSLDEERDGPLRLSIGRGDGTRVTALVSGEGPGSTRFAFAVGRGMIVVGTDADAVAEVLAGGGAERSGKGPRPAVLDARERYFPDASTFAYLDLGAVVRIATERRAELGTLLDVPTEDEDLDRLLDLISLFRGAYVSSSLSEDGTLARQRLGLLLSEAEGP
ncbi:hypothetical protein [Tautonia sociabilis]|uniref:DUF3352 domain-containing protein n=1 Tax=Tautonia sociabilis TaxID=2080755 RepID=A0A432MGR6_9BACT|nr:hypothetical protein [Tautonia sociabilis]RUL86088.1 hypothetical protein TsocGM_16860 [Tautonia sociabilis]